MIAVVAVESVVFDVAPWNLYIIAHNLDVAFSENIEDRGILLDSFD